MENITKNDTKLNYFKDLKMPKILDDITFKFARTVYPDMATSCLLGVVLNLVGFGISHKRIKFDEYNNGANVRNFNIYTINFAPSGVGKDRLYKDVCNKILKYIFGYMKEKVEKHIEKLKNEIIKKAEKPFADHAQPYLPAAGAYHARCPMKSRAYNVRPGSFRLQSPRARQ